MGTVPWGMGSGERPHIIKKQIIHLLAILSCV